MGIDKERTNECIVTEIKGLLDELGEEAPYVLIANDTSNIYAMYFQKKFPNLVESIISIDGLYPREINDTFYLQELRKEISNIKMTSLFELTGFERVLSYAKPEVFGIDKMELLTQNYSENDLKIYRSRIGSSYLTKTMINEINKLEDNINEVIDYTYPDYLPVLEILSSELIDKYEFNKQQGNSNVTYPLLANELLTNTTLQRVIKIDGENMLQLSNPTVLVDEINKFFGTYVIQY